MCLGIPGRIVRPEPAHADTVVVDVLGKEQLVNTALLDDELGVGDWVVIHMGFALESLTEAEAAEALEILSVLGPNAGSEPVAHEEPSAPW